MQLSFQSGYSWSFQQASAAKEVKCFKFIGYDVLRIHKSMAHFATDNNVSGAKIMNRT